MTEIAEIVMAVLDKRRIRNMRPGEVLPEKFEVGFDQLGRLDHNWVWIAERRGQIEGCIVASPCHGVALIWRLVSFAGSAGMLPLCRRFMKDCKARGIRGYLTLVDPEVKTQARLMRVILRGKGKVAGTFHLMASPLVEGL
jgi:hypothetical protein